MNFRTLLFALSIVVLSGNLPAAAQIPSVVEQALQAGKIPREQVAIVVQAVGEERPILAHNADALMNPASVMKLLTTYAALDLLGPAHVWQTDALVEREPAAGVLPGNLYLRGSGDPKLSSEQLWFLLRKLRVRGIERITGDIVLDRSAFAPVDFDPAAFDSKPLRAYNVGPDALLLDFQALRFTLQPDVARPRILLESPSADLVVDNGLSNSNGPCPADWRDRIQLAVKPDAGRRRLEVRGSYASRCGERALNLAPLAADSHADGLLRALWRELGGRLDGRVRNGVTPTGAIPFARQESPPLADLVRDINKYSNNVMARQVFLSLGNDGSAASAEQARRRITAWLTTRGLDFPGMVLDNGSGLSRQERISADQLNQLLLDAWRNPLMPEFIASLPLAGVDGTMKKRLNGSPVAGRAHIKTGTLDGVRSAAGYALDRAGRRYALTILINAPQAQEGGAAIDALLDWIAVRQ